MKIILTTNIKKLGKIGEVVSVKDGFARNYLFPNNMALRNTKKNSEYYDNIKDNMIEKEKNKLDDAKNLINQIGKLNIIFNKEADDKDQLYGSISKKEILDYLLSNNVKVKSDDLIIRQPIKALGEHEIEINPYIEITQVFKLIVKKN
ncbi:MAG: 50S ribosomal protein L9 [Alphaproteobacteria bacterium]